MGALLFLILWIRARGTFEQFRGWNINAIAGIVFKEQDLYRGGRGVHAGGTAVPRHA
jgi:hypothetical protein